MAALLCLLPGCSTGGGGAEALRDSAPVELSDAVRAELAPSGVRVLRGGRPFIDFWFRSALPIGAPRREEGVLYGALRAGSLIGAVRVHADGRDYRAQKLPAGLYTMRYDVQPDDGEHLNITESRDFLLLCAAADDRNPASLDEEDLHKLSSQLHSKKHPAVLFLTATQSGPSPRVRSRDAHHPVLLDVDVPTTGGTPLRIAIVVVGRYPE